MREYLKDVLPRLRMYVQLVLADVRDDIDPVDRSIQGHTRE